MKLTQRELREGQANLVKALEDQRRLLHYWGIPAAEVARFVGKTAVYQGGPTE